MPKFSCKASDIPFGNSFQCLFLLRCGNKYDLKSKILVSDAEMEGFCEQCRNLVSGIYKTSCKTGEGIEEMFRDIAKQLSDSNKYV